MAQGLSNTMPEQQLALYMEDYYDRSDIVYRFGALLTLSREGGEKIVEDAYRILLSDFSRLTKGNQPVLTLMDLAWKSFLKLRSEQFHESTLGIFQACKSMTVEERAILYLVDMAGLELMDAARIIGASAESVTKALAGANKYLATSELLV